MCIRDSIVPELGTDRPRRAQEVADRLGMERETWISFLEALGYADQTRPPDNQRVGVEEIADLPTGLLK